MTNIYKSVVDLARSIRMQNLFLVSKEIASIKLFKNNFNFSKLQEIYISYLYTFDLLNKDIVVEGISKKVMEHEIFWESYLTYKRSNKKNREQSDNKKDVNLVVGKEIHFPTKGTK